jgi:hypothetical protein
MRNVGIGTWLLLAVAILALVWLTVPTGILQMPTLAGGLDILWPFRYQPWLIVLAALEGLALWGAFALFVFRRTVATLMTRQSPRANVVWDACDECDPSEEKVDRFGRQLAGIPQPVMHWADWRATAVRIQMLSVGQGKVEYRLQVAERMSAGLRAAMDQIGCEGERGPIHVDPPVWPRGGTPVGGQEQVDE